MYAQQANAEKVSPVGGTGTGTLVVLGTGESIYICIWLLYHLYYYHSWFFYFRCNTPCRLDVCMRVCVYRSINRQKFDRVVWELLTTRTHDGGSSEDDRQWLTDSSLATCFSGRRRRGRRWLCSGRREGQLAGASSIVKTKPPRFLITDKTNKDIITGIIFSVEEKKRCAK